MNTIKDLKNWLEDNARFHDDFEVNMMLHRIRHGIPEEGQEEAHHRIQKTYFNDCLKIVEEYERQAEKLSKYERQEEEFKNAYKKVQEAYSDVWGIYGT